MLYDLVINDESIINDGFFVRDSISNDNKLLTRLVELIKEAELTTPNSSQLRDYILSILLRVSQRDAAFQESIDEVMKKHIELLTAGLLKHPQKKDLLEGEIKLTEDVLRADKLPNMQNFPEIEPVSMNITRVRRPTISKIKPPDNQPGQQN